MSLRELTTSKKHLSASVFLSDSRSSSVEELLPKSRLIFQLAFSLGDSRLFNVRQFLVFLGEGKREFLNAGSLMGSSVQPAVHPKRGMRPSWAWCLLPPALFFSAPRLQQLGLGRIPNRRRFNSIFGCMTVLCRLYWCFSTLFIFPGAYHTAGERALRVPSYVRPGHQARIRRFVLRRRSSMHRGGVYWGRQVPTVS